MMEDYKYSHVSCGTLLINHNQRNTFVYRIFNTPAIGASSWIYMLDGRITEVLV
jgi:hypothetical protein